MSDWSDEILPAGTPSAPPEPDWSDSMLETKPPNRLGLNLLQNEKPDRAVRVLDAQKKTGLPINLVDSQLELVEQEAAKREFDPEKFAKDSPGVAKWMSENPQQAAIGKGELENLSSLEKFFRVMSPAYAAYKAFEDRPGEDSIADVLKKSTKQAGYMFLQSHGGMEQYMAGKTIREVAPITPQEAVDHARKMGLIGKDDVVDLSQGLLDKPELLDAVMKAADDLEQSEFERMAKGGRERFEFASQEIKELQPKVIPGSAKYYLGASTQAFFGSVLPMIGVSLATGGSATPGLVAMGTQVFGQRFGESIKDGRTIPQAKADAWFYTLAETIPERIPLGIALKRGTPFFERLFQASWTEGAQEMFTEVLQSGYDTGILNEDMSLDEAMRRVVDAGIVGALMGGSMATVTHVAQKPGEMIQKNRIKRQADEQKNFFLALGENSTESKLREQLPDKYRELVKNLTKDGPVENVYTPIEFFQSRLEQAGVNPRQMAIDLGIERQYDEAMETGGKLVIPTSVYAAKIAPTEFNADFAAELTITPDGLTSREMQELQEEFEKSKEAEPDLFEQNLQKVREDVQGQLAKIMPPDQAEQHATLWESRYRARAERLGIDPWTLYEQRRKTFTREMPGFLAQPGKAVEEIKSGKIESPEAQAVASFLSQTGVKPADIESFLAGKMPLKKSMEQGLMNVPRETKFTDREGRPVNPIDRALPPMEKAKALHALGQENDPVVKEALKAVEAAIPGTKTATNFKTLEKIVAKGRRATVKAKRPYWDVEYVRDSYRFKTVIPDLSQAAQALEVLLAEMEKSFGAQVEVLKIDLDKLNGEGMWGWRTLPVDFRMPNGQIVEYYFTTPELQLAQDTKGHQLFEDWRERDIDSLSKEELAQLYEAAAESKRLYEAAWAAGASRLGVDPNAVAASVKSAFASSPLASGQRAISTTLRPGGAESAQAPSGERKAISPEGERMKTRLPSGSTETMEFGDIDFTSDESVAKKSILSKQPMAFEATKENTPNWAHIFYDIDESIPNPVKDLNEAPNVIAGILSRNENDPNVEMFKRDPNTVQHRITLPEFTQVRVIASIIDKLHKIGVPEQIFSTVRAFLIENTVDGFQMTHWGLPVATYGNRSYLSVRFDILQRLIDENISNDATVFAVATMMVHEAVHSLDVTEGDGNGFTSRSPLFDLTNLRTPGPVINEAIETFRNDSLGLTGLLSYPFAYMPNMMLEHPFGWMPFIQKETFAQLGAIYYTLGATPQGREKLMAVMPQSVKLFDEVNHVLKTSRTVGDRREGIRLALQSTYPDLDSMGRRAAYAGTAATGIEGQRAPDRAGVQTGGAATAAVSGYADVFASPNIEEALTLKEAAELISTPEQESFRGQAEQFAKQADTQAETNNALGVWTDGAENSTHTHLPNVDSIEKLREIAAAQGLDGKQKSAALFIDAEGGADVLHELEAAGTIPEIDKILRDNGIQFMTYETLGDKVLVTIIDSGGELIENAANAAQALQATHSFRIGTAEFLGAETREEARRVFEGTLASRRGQALLPTWGGHTTSKASLDSLTEALFQKERGVTRITDRTVNIELFKDANLSTFLHETGHTFLLEMYDDVQYLRSQEKPTAKQQTLIDDFGKLLNWMGITEQELLDKSKKSVEANEQFARGFEAYLAEGKAPTQELRGVFQRFKAWLVHVYKLWRTDAKISRELNVRLNDEVRAIMDRLLATDEQIKAAQTESEIRPVFTDAVTAGMTDTEFTAYQKTLEEANAKEHEKLEKELIKEYTREREKWWKEARAKIRAEVEAEVNDRPVYRAILGLTKGLPDGTKIKIDRKFLIENYGKEFLERIPHIYAAKDGVHPDMAAEMFGFESGDKLLKLIAAAQKREQVIENETDLRMKTEHGDMLTDGTLYAKAQEAVRDENRSEIIAAELKALHKKAREVKPFVEAAKKGEKEKRVAGRQIYLAAIPTVQQAREQAEKTILQTRVRDIRPMQYYAAARKASKAAIEAVNKGDFILAAVNKRQELIANELYRAAIKVQKLTEKTVKYARKFEKRDVRESIGKAGQDYLEQIDNILEQFEFKPVSLKQIDRRKSLLAWVTAQQEKGVPIIIDPEILEQARNINYKEVTVETLMGIRDALRNIEHVARFKNKLMREAAKRDLDELTIDIADSIAAHAKKVRKRNIETHLPKEETARAIDSWFASHRKFASYARQMDGFKDGGILWEYLVRPMNEAADREAVMKEQALLKLWELFEKHGQIKGLYKKMYIPEIDYSIAKMGRLMVALNWGNEGNRQRLKDGYHWVDSQVQAILDTLEKNDWAFVQDIFDFIDSYWPETSDKEQRVTGLAPKKIDAAPIKTRFGEFRGGYFPVEYDTRQSPRAYADSAKEAADRTINGFYTRAQTDRGRTIERVREVKDRPLRLDFGVIFENIQATIHDLTHHEMLIDANKILGHKTVQKAIIDHYGDIVYRQMQKIVNDVAAGDVPATKAWEKAINWIRTGTSMAAMGWNLTTATIQLLGASQSVVRIGGKWFGKGVSRFLGDAAHMQNAYAWVQEKSPFMRLRAKTMQREINEIRNVIQGKAKLQAVQDTYFWFISKMQAVVDIPTWIGQYEKSMAKHGDEAKAITEADQAVIDSQGSGHIKDLSEMQRGGPLMKLWTNFYHYFNTTFNLTAESFHKTDFKHPAEVGRFMVDMLLLYTVPAILGYLIREGLRGGLDDDDKIVEELIREQLGYMAGTMIGLRELSGIIQGYYGYQGPAGTRLFGEAGGLIQQAGQGELDEALIRKLNSTAGILFHYPSGQIDKTARGIFAYTEGKTDNPLAMLYGPPPKNR